MMRFLTILCCFIMALAHAENITFEQAGEAARKVTIPNFTDLITQDKINNTLPPSSFGDTTSLSDMRGDDGMGDIRTPGLNKAIACDSKNDPECLAIQMLRYGSANNPKFDEATEVQIKGQYSTTIGNKDSILGDLNDLGSTERVCETVETVIPGQSATEVCDIITASDTTQGICEEGWEESKSLLVYYQCTMKALEVDSTCDVITTPITHNEDIYQCTDRAAVYEDSTCAITTTAVTHNEDIYQCTDRAAVMEDNVCMVTTTAITHNQDIYQCTDRKDVFQENACAVTTTPITHNEDIYQCTDRSAVYEDSSCAVTTTAVTHKEDIYQCIDRKDVFEENACTVTTTPVTHTEDIYQCTDRAAEYETRTCDVPATVTVEKTYPYTCPITMAEEKKKSCVRTLNVVVTPLCSTNPSETIRLNPFRENYGWKPSSSYLRLEATLTCAETLSAITLTFKSAGSVVATMSSFPASTTITIKGFAMTIDVKRVTINAEPYLEVLITNVDTGQGTTTIATNLLMQTTKQQEHDVWSETCEEVAQ